jgi:hypothetical protein
VARAPDLTDRQLASPEILAEIPTPSAGSDAVGAELRVSNDGFLDMAIGKRELAWSYAYAVDEVGLENAYLDARGELEIVLLLGVLEATGELYENEDFWAPLQ